MREFIFECLAAGVSFAAFLFCMHYMLVQLKKERHLRLYEVGVLGTVIAASFLMLSRYIAYMSVILSGWEVICESGSTTVL